MYYSWTYEYRCGATVVEVVVEEESREAAIARAVELTGLPIDSGWSLKLVNQLTMEWHEKRAELEERGVIPSDERAADGDSSGAHS